MVKDFAAEGIEASIEMGDVMAGGAGTLTRSPTSPRRSKADLIVTGTRGHSPVAGLLVGSVTQRLLHIAKQPILVVPATD